MLLGWLLAWDVLGLPASLKIVVWSGCKLLSVAMRSWGWEVGETCAFFCYWHARSPSTMTLTRIDTCSVAVCQNRSKM